MNDPSHARYNAFKSAKDFRVHILAWHTEVLQPIAHAL